MGTRNTYEDDEAVAQATAGRKVSATGWIRANCPFCLMTTGKADRRQALGLNARTLGYNCFKCGATGKLRLNPDEYDLPELGDEEPVQAKPVERPEGFFLLDEESRGAMSLEPAWHYLTAPQMKGPHGGRGLSARQVMDAGLGACVAGKFTGRVIIPITDAVGTWWWFVGRSWSKVAEIPYLYPRGIRDGLMYNEHAINVETDEPLLVMEGCFDALWYWPHAVAVLGKTTDAHMERLARARRPVVFCPDGDEWESGDMLAMRMRLDGHRAGAIKLPPRIDPDEIPVRELRRAAMESLTD